MLNDGWLLLRMMFRRVNTDSLIVVVDRWLIMTDSVQQLKNMQKRMAHNDCSK